MASFPRQPGKPVSEKQKQEMMEWQWHQLDHIIYILLHIDNTLAPHHSIFYGPDALPAVQLTVSKHWSHLQHHATNTDCIQYKNITATLGKVPLQLFLKHHYNLILVNLIWQ